MVDSHFMYGFLMVTAINWAFFAFALWDLQVTSDSGGSFIESVGWGRLTSLILDSVVLLGVGMIGRPFPESKFLFALLVELGVGLLSIALVATSNTLEDK